MTETNTQICDSCLKEFESSGGDFWFTVGRDHTTEKIHFCPKCYEIIGESEETRCAYTLKCAVCSTEGNPYKRTCDFKRVKPGVFVCYNGDCYEVWGVSLEVNKRRSTNPVT